MLGVMAEVRHTRRTFFSYSRDSKSDLSNELELDTCPLHEMPVQWTMQEAERCQTNRSGLFEQNLCEKGEKRMDANQATYRHPPARRTLTSIYAFSALVAALMAAASTAGLCISLGQAFTPPEWAKIVRSGGIVGSIALTLATFVLCMSTFFFKKLESAGLYRAVATGVTLASALITVFIAIAAILGIRPATI